ncbi:hypothetical protein BJ165DRAFT_1597566 [Panaeolus papilionaceus]|nr:hypothetical protein BJ165DRAFT_1597566 [Panaeolus papilionaceus]
MNERTGTRHGKLTTHVMLIIEPVIVGASGVGKTSFHVKGNRLNQDLLPPGYPKSEYLHELLQRSDTASQERFSSFSTAFFRGADTVRDEDEAKFCVAVVGNKVDVVEGGAEGQDEQDQNSDRVSRDEAMRFLSELVPLDDEDAQSVRQLSIQRNDTHHDDTQFISGWRPTFYRHPNPTASSPSLSPSPSQRLLKGLTAHSVHIEPLILCGNLNSADSGQCRALARIIPLMWVWGRLVLRRGWGQLGGVKLVVCGLVEVQRYGDSDDGGRRVGVPVAVSVDGLGFGSRSTGRSLFGVRGMAGPRIVSRRMSSMGLRNGDGLKKPIRVGVAWEHYLIRLIIPTDQGSCFISHFWENGVHVEVFQCVARRVMERWDKEDDEAEAEAEISGSAMGGIEVGGSRRGRGRGRTTGRGRGEAIGR